MIERAKASFDSVRGRSSGWRPTPTNQDTAKAIIAFRETCRTPGLHELGSAYGAKLGLMLDRELIVTLRVIGEHAHEYDKPLSLQTVGPETCLRQMERLVVYPSPTAFRKPEERFEAARIQVEPG